MGKKVPKAVRDYMSRIGSKGGAASGERKARDPEKMRQAALKRWKKRPNKSIES